jgi:hypothetical protein
MSPGFRAKVNTVNPTKTTNNSATNRNHFDLNISHFPLLNKKTRCAFEKTHANIEPKIADIAYLELQIDYKLSVTCL